MVSHPSKELCFARQIGANSPVRTGGGARGHKSWLLVLLPWYHSSAGKEAAGLLIRSEKKALENPGWTMLLGCKSHDDLMSRTIRPGPAP